MTRTSGQLETTGTGLDFEEESSYMVTVQVADDSNFADDDNAEITVTITVTDVNEAPMFPDTTAGVYVYEGDKGQMVFDSNGVLKATDPDEDTLTYALSGAHAGSFTINGSSGQLTTDATLAAAANISVTVTATDRSGLSDTQANVSITVRPVTDDEVDPMFPVTEIGERTIAENAAIDADVGDAVAVTKGDDADVLRYSIPTTGDAASFTIDTINNGDGQLKTKVMLDYETKSSYTVVVTVSDGKQSANKTFTITVTDVAEAPEFPEDEDGEREVAENAAIGALVDAPVRAMDSDGDTLEYTLGGTDVASFEIVPTTGQLKTLVELDRETAPSYTVEVTASDGTSTDATIAVTITVTDANDAPVFADAVVRIGVPEDTEPGTAVSEDTPVAEVSDPDDDDLTYSIPSSGDATSFEIDRTTGQLKLTAALDYEGPSPKRAYTFDLTVSDGKGGTDTVSIAITVMGVDEPPMFATETTIRMVAEKLVDPDDDDAIVVPPAGTPVGDPVTATDPDSGDTVTYQLGGTDAASFAIDTSGQLKTRTGLDLTLDRETKDEYTVTVTAADDDDFTDDDNAEITVTIRVTDVNEAPVFPETEDGARSIPENTRAGRPIGLPLVAEDPEMSRLTYALAEGEDEDPASFTISSSGQLRTLAALDFEDKASYTVTVTATDGGDETGRD